MAADTACRYISVPRISHGLNDVPPVPALLKAPRARSKVLHSLWARVGDDGVGGESTIGTGPPLVAGVLG